MTKYVIDTSSFIQNLSDIPMKDAIVSTLVLQELEKHKSNYSNPALQKHARDALRAIEENQDVVEFDFNQYPSFEFLKEHYDTSYTDNRLLESLFHFKNQGREVGLFSDDLSLLLQAKSFGFPIIKGNDVIGEPYQGTICISVTDPRMATFYNMYHKSKKHHNIFDLQIGEYFVVVDELDCEENESEEEKIVSAFKWNGTSYQRITMSQRLHSSYFSNVEPKNFRQAIAMDSLKNNDVTILTGGAGSGKTYLALSYIMQQVESYEIPVYIVTDNVPLRGSHTFGLKKGDILKKILQSNLGNILKNKIGIDQVELLVDKEKINIIALEDIRGMSINGIVYGTEVQNWTDDTVKTVLERIEGEYGQAIFEGDQRQIDTHNAKGKSSGIHRVCEVFQNTGVFGHVELKENLRKGISAIAGKM